MTPLNNILVWLSSAPFLHIAGIAAVTTLMGVGTVSTETGLPILTGLIGLGITTLPNAVPSSPTVATKASPAPAAPVAAPGNVAPPAG